MPYYTRVLTSFSNDKISLEKGDIIENIDMGLSIVVKTGQEFHPIQDILGLETETLITPDEEGAFFVRDSVYGWNNSYWFKPFGTEKSESSDKFYRLKKGESIIKDYPMWDSRESQLAWLENRKVGYFPPQEIKPVKYILEKDILKTSSLEELLEVTGLKLEDLTLSKESQVDPGKYFREKGFYLGMPEKEMKELGELFYRCFNSYKVKRDLEVEPHLESIYQTPKIWVKVSLKNGKLWKVQKTFTVKIREYDDKTEFEVNNVK